MAIITRAESVTAKESLSARLNWLRAGVLGANDGIVSTAGLVFGVAGASTSHTALVIAGLAGMVAGALSMAGGEYVSVSSQRDTELAVKDSHHRQALGDPETLRSRLHQHYLGLGLSPDIAESVARELSTDPLAAGQALGAIDPDGPVSPWAAARASMAAFVAGALIPLLAIWFAPDSIRLPATCLAVWLALGLTGALSANLGGAPKAPAVVRNLVVGTVTMVLTFVAGSLVGPQLA